MRRKERRCTVDEVKGEKVYCGLGERREGVLWMRRKVRRCTVDEEKGEKVYCRMKESGRNSSILVAKFS